MQIQAQQQLKSRTTSLGVGQNTTPKKERREIAALAVSLRAPRDHAGTRDRTTAADFSSRRLGLLPGARWARGTASS